MSRPKSIIIKNNDYRELSKKYYEYQKRMGYAKETCSTRRLNIDEFLSYQEQRGKIKIEETTTEEIQSFYDYISQRPNKQREGILSQKTTFNIMTSIEHLFRMLQSEGEIQLNPISVLKFPYPRESPKREILNQEQINELYKVSQTSQERAILSLGYGCGLRVGEMEKINIEDIRLRERIVIIQKGKGGKRRVVPMSPGVEKDLSDYYFRERELYTTKRNYNRKQRAFMLNSRGGRMRERTYNKYLKKIIARTKDEEMKTKKISMHSLRHSIATHLIEQGIPVEQVRRFLGHSQLETTQVYTHISKEQLKRIIG